ncbi:hypothetical protein B566_EDAN010222 [Ephemera danica]|nr:hypothetical protein B566_EDAN010222 [Ephemera danica]
MCLPASCDLKDVRTILEMSSDIATSALSGGNSRNLTILALKSPDLDDYKYWRDPTFIILAVVGSLVGLLMALGSAYDLRLRRQLRPLQFAVQQHCQHCKQTQNGAIALDVISVPNKKQAATVVAVKECNGNHAIDSYGSAELSLEEKTYEEKSNKEESSWLQYGRAFLLCFSVPQNARAIFDQSVGGDTLSTLHGLRFLSMVWVILGHSCIVAFKYADNTNFRGVVEREFLFQTISNAAFSVDTFFFISGLLFSFLYFRTAAKVDLNVITRATGLKSKFLQMIGLLAYRFGRLTSPYLFVLGAVQISMKWFHHKSVFDPPTLDHENCPKYWWRNALYINTLFPVKDMCMLWSWYLADDTQFYVLGAILMILALSHFRTAAGLFVTFMVSSWFTTAYIAFTNNHQPSVDDPLALFDKIYDKPWTRLGPYLVGMGTGWLLYNIDCKLKLNRGGVALGWSVCAATLLSLLYGLYDARLDAVSSAAYSSLSHSAWALGTAWIVVACSPVRKILSAPILYPLSRVTYCAYLVHPMVIRTMVISESETINL